MLEKQISFPNLEILDRTGSMHAITHHASEEMTVDQLAELARELTPITGQGFMRDNIYGDELYRDVHDHIAHAKRLVIARSAIGGKVSTYIASAVIETEMGNLYHLGGIICAPEFQGAGVAEKLLRQELQVTKAHYLGFHTQSRRMQGLGYKVAFLNIADSEHLAEVIGSKSQLGIIDKARYGGQPLYQNQNEAQTIAIQDIEGLQFDQGDALICVGPVRGLSL